MSVNPVFKVWKSQSRSIQTRVALTNLTSMCSLVISLVTTSIALLASSLETQKETQMPCLQSVVRQSTRTRNSWRSTLRMRKTMHCQKLTTGLIWASNHHRRRERVAATENTHQSIAQVEPSMTCRQTTLSTETKVPIWSKSRPFSPTLFQEENRHRK